MYCLRRYFDLHITDNVLLTSNGPYVLNNCSMPRRTPLGSRGIAPLPVIDPRSGLARLLIDVLNDSVSHKADTLT